MQQCYKKREEINEWDMRKDLTIIYLGRFILGIWKPKSRKIKSLAKNIQQVMGRLKYHTALNTNEKITF